MSQDTPWLLLTSDEVLRGINIFRSRALLSKIALRFFRKILSRSNNKKNVAPWLFDEPRTGFGLIQYKPSKNNKKIEGKDKPYEALQQVLKASIVRQAEANEDIEFAIIFPVIIVDAPLFECFLEKDSDIQIKKIERGVVYQPRMVHGIRAPMVRIISRSYLYPFIQEIKSTADGILKIADENSDLIIEIENKLLESVDKKKTN